jgi:hypothetical protein
MLAKEPLGLAAENFEATQMRFGLISLICLSCIACARLQKSAEQEPPTIATPKQAPPVVDHETSTVFECSDGTISTSQDACIVSMANRRLPPSQQVDRSPIKPAAATIETPTGATR